MSVATELQRIIDAKADLKTAIEAKGVTVSSSALIDDYADYVDAIPSGGGAVEEKTVNFIDFDGTLVASYTGEEVQALTALPDGPDHSNDEVPLTFDEWNWTLAEIKSNNTSYPKAIITIGPTYHTTDNKYHLWFDAAGLSECTVAIGFGNDNTNTKTVNWGDETATEILSGQIIEHTYTNGLKNHCVIETTSTTIGSVRNDGISQYKKTALTNIRCPSHCERVNLYMFYNLMDISIPSGVDFYGLLANAVKCLVVPRGQTTENNCSFSPKALRYLSISPLFTAEITTAISETCLSSLFIPNAPSFRSIFNNPQLLNICLPNATLGASNTNLQKNYNLLEVQLKNQDITSLPYYFFSDCYSIRNISIPESVTEISGYTFSNCFSLEEVTLPANVQTIGSNTFPSGLVLRSITSLATTPPTLSSALPTTLEKIYVPYSADHSVLTTYQNATNWSALAAKMEELPQ